MGRKFRSHWAFGVVHRKPKPPGQVLRERLILFVILLLVLYVLCRCLFGGKGDSDKDKDASASNHSQQQERLAAVGEWYLSRLLSICLPVGTYIETQNTGKDMQASGGGNVAPAIPEEAGKNQVVSGGPSDEKNETPSDQMVSFEGELKNQLGNGSLLVGEWTGGAEILSPQPGETEADIPVNGTTSPFVTALSAAASATDWEQIEYSVMKQYYTVNSNTSVAPEVLPLDAFLQMDFSLTGEEKKTILIYHTHSQEAFRDSPNTDPAYTILAVGEVLAQILRDTYGYEVIHLTDSFDVVDGKLSRSGAYGRAAQKLQEVLQQNPQIDVMLDLHRDGVGENVHLISEQEGKAAAKLMVFNGVCRDANGPLADAVNPYEQENLAFGFQLRLALDTFSPGITRTNYLKQGTYNLNFLPRSILIEVGAQTNTLQEAKNAMPALAKALHFVLER